MAKTNIAQTSARFLSELLHGPTVNFYVGPERRQWSLHLNLLCHHSAYFEAQFMGNEVPHPVGKELKLDLPDDDPAGFELLVKWLYQGQLDDMSGMTDEEKYDYAVACHKLYMLCDKFDLPLKNEAIDRYRQGLHEAQLVPDAAEINDIYRSSPIGSPFRKLMTQIAARQIMDPGSDKSAESYHKCFENNPDFAVDMVNAIKAGTGGLLFDDPTEENQCDYHDHSEGQECRYREMGRLMSSPRRRNTPQPNKAPSSVPIKVDRVSSAIDITNGSSGQQTISFASQQQFDRATTTTDAANRSQAPQILGVNGVISVDNIGRVNSSDKRNEHERDKHDRRDSLLSTGTSPGVRSPPSRGGGTTGAGRSHSVGGGSGGEATPAKKKNPPKLRRRTEAEVLW